MAIRIIFGLPAVLACLVCTGLMAWRFGWQLGSEEIDRYIYAGAGVAVDVIKGLLPILIVVAWRQRQWTYCAMAAAAFALFTSCSLLASFGLAAIQGASKAAEHKAVSTFYQDQRAEFDRLLAEKGWLGTIEPISPEAEQHAKDAIAAAESARDAECANGFGGRCREKEDTVRKRHDELAKVSAALAANIKAKALDDRITAVRAKLEGVDLKAVSREADPQAAALATLLRSHIGDDKQHIRAFIHLVIAVVLEVGSGLGLYLVFGTHIPAAPSSARVPAPRSAAHARIAKASRVVDLEQVPGDVGQFVLAQLEPGEAVGERDVYRAYESWCKEHGFKPVSRAKFTSGFAALCDESGFRRSDGKIYGMALVKPKPMPRLGHMATLGRT